MPKERIGRAPHVAERRPGTGQPYVLAWRDLNLTQLDEFQADVDSRRRGDAEARRMQRA